MNWKDMMTAFIRCWFQKEITRKHIPFKVRWKVWRFLWFRHLPFCIMPLALHLYFWLTWEAFFGGNHGDADSPGRMLCEKGRGRIWTGSVQKDVCGRCGIFEKWAGLLAVTSYFTVSFLPAMHFPQLFYRILRWIMTMGNMCICLPWDGWWWGGC